MDLKGFSRLAHDQKRQNILLICIANVAEIIAYEKLFVRNRDAYTGYIYLWQSLAMIVKRCKITRDTLSNSLMVA